MNTAETEKVDGYDLPVYGKGNNTFYYIHIPALTCISLSFCSVIIVLVLSFRRQSYKTFFQWTKSQRFVVYLALCDGGYNVFHFIDHLTYVIQHDHVRPKELCEFYAFTLVVFIMSQILMVNIVATNAFMLMFFNRNLNFGRFDYRLLCWAYGAPFIGGVAAVIAGQMGPNGSFCFFDGVKGNLTYLLFTTVPLLIIFILNSVMYIATWIKIKQQTRPARKSLKKSAEITGRRVTESTSHQAAKTWSMFVVAFFVQWWSLAVLGVWSWSGGNVSQVIFHFVTTLTNLGGVFNMVIYGFMRKRIMCYRGKKYKTAATDTGTSKSANMDVVGREAHDKEMSENTEIG